MTKLVQSRTLILGARGGPMKILLTGATGFVGRELGKALVRQGHQLHVLTRNASKARESLPFPAACIECDLNEEDLPETALDGVEAVIHLAGESIAAKRWGYLQKKRILESRTRSTQKIAQAIADQKPGKIKAAIFASAIGYYGNRGDERLDEASRPGRGFLSDVCRQWEEAGKIVSIPEVRTVFVRIGIVLGYGGGMMEKVLPIFKAGVGGPLGNGRQWMSWIHVQDLVRLFVEALENEKMAGPVNGVAPEPVTNGEFTRALSETVGRPALFPAPALALKTVLGEMSELMLGSQKVYPVQATSLGFSFQYPELKAALREICGEERGDVFVCHQWLPAPIDNVFAFFSEAKNLQEITPPWLEFEILGASTPSIQKDTRLDYRLKIREIPVKWTTLITDWNPPKSFQDVQLKGPYARWHHTHTFESLGGGTLVTDRVEYRVPLGYLGQMTCGFFVKKDIEKIFDHRRLKIREKLM